MTATHERYFFDIPVLRCEEKVFLDEKSNETSNLEALYRNQLGGINPGYDYRNLAKISVDSKYSNYLYGELVGMIRLFAIRGQIRAELHFVKERISKNLKNKTWRLVETKVFEYWINDTDSNERIHSWIVEKIKEENRSGKLNDRFIKLEQFELTGRYIDYRDLAHFD